MTNTPTTDTAEGGGAVDIGRDLQRWKDYLREQEHLCAEHGFAAAMVTVAFDPAEDLEPALDAVRRTLRSTDRAAVLCPTELAVLLVPVDSIHHAQRLVHVLDSALRSTGVAHHVGWAMRLDGHGLFHAAARADAAMLSARGHGTPSVDLAER